MKPNAFINFIYHTRKDLDCIFELDIFVIFVIYNI